MGACEFLEHSYITSFRSRKRPQNSTSRASSTSSSSFFLSSPSQVPDSISTSVATANTADTADTDDTDDTADTAHTRDDEPAISTAIGSTLEEPSSLPEGFVDISGLSGNAISLSFLATSSSSPSSSSPSSCSALEGCFNASNAFGNIDTLSASGPGSELNRSYADAQAGGSEHSSSSTIINSAASIPVNTNLELTPLSLLATSEPTIIGGGLTASHNKVIPTVMDVESQDCAICLDKILPKQHAKATLACRHEFHLSCISMAFAMGKEMICPLCRYLHKNQPFMNQESDSDIKPTSGQPIPASNQERSYQNPHPFSRSPLATFHEHPTSGTVLSMMPSLFETSLGHGPTAGIIRTAPDGICLKTSTWLILYVIPFTIALFFLTFVLGKVETLWSKISCLIGAAICYMVCWALVVAIMNPDHEARALLERLNQMQQDDLLLETEPLSPISSISNSNTTQQLSSFDNNTNGARLISGSDDATTSTTLNSNSPTTTTSSSFSSEPLPSFWTTWTQHRYAQNIQNRVVDLSRMLDDLPGDWW